MRKPQAVGGQAVIEGVMMRGPAMIATAVRRKDGSITVKKEPYAALSERFPLLKLPVIRGALGLIEMLVIGIRTLNYSAEVALLDEAASAGGKDGDGSGLDGNGSKTKVGRKEGLSLGITVALAAIVGVAIFFAVPLVAATLFFKVDQDPLGFNLVTGLIRTVLFLTYLLAIAQLADVKRLFAYHGAEHKSVFAFEAGEPLAVASASGKSRFHPRCGTSFLLIVMLVAILLFAIVDAILILQLGAISLPLRLAVHLPFVPFVGGVAYEFIRLSARGSNTLAGKIAVAPGLWLQRITTREPDNGQLEVALVALRAALGREEELSIPDVQKLSVN